MVVLSERSEPKDLSQMPNKPHIAPKAFRFTHFPKNTSASPLESHTFKTKDLKPFRFIHFQKKWGVPVALTAAKGTCHANATLLSKPRPVETGHLPSAANHESRLFPRLPAETVARTMAFPQWTAHPLQTAWPVAHGTSTKSGTPIGKSARQMAATSWYFAYA